LTITRRPALLCVVLALAGCTDWAGYDIDVALGEIPAISTMRRDVVPDRYDMLRLPPDGTVPVVHPLGDVPAPYAQTQLDSIAPLLVSPFQATPEVLQRGRLAYDTYCSVCHGATGDGQGSVIAQNKFPFALPIGPGSPSVGRSDGYLYAVIDVGRGLMPPYGHRMTHGDRWAVVHYLRQLQGAAGPPAAASCATPQAPADTASAPADGSPVQAPADEPARPTTEN
jgi:mono/diheme cytochrome c family protein